MHKSVLKIIEKLNQAERSQLERYSLAQLMELHELLKTRRPVWLHTYRSYSDSVTCIQLQRLIVYLLGFSVVTITVPDIAECHPTMQDLAFYFGYLQTDTVQRIDECREASELIV